MTTTSTATETDDATDPHNSAGPPLVGDTDSLPSYPELTRTLVEPGGLATLSTLTWSGHPYASLAPYSTLDSGAPLICVSSLAEHTQNLRRDPRASVLVEAPAVADVDPLSLARVTILGAFMPYAPCGDEIEGYLAVHRHAQHYVGFPDFSWWRFDVANLRYVGGFGLMGWGTGEEYLASSADPVLPHAEPMIAHLNVDHGDACLSIARRIGGVADAADANVVTIDRYGMTFETHDAGGSSLATVRVAFAEPLTQPDQVRAASIELVRRATA